MCQCVFVIPFLNFIFSSSASLHIWSSYCEKALATASGLSSLPPSDVVSNILPQSSLPSLSTTSFTFISLLSLATILFTCIWYMYPLLECRLLEEKNCVCVGTSILHNLKSLPRTHAYLSFTKL